MKKWILIALLPMLLIACKGKKKAPLDGEGITTADFIGFFDEVKPPYSLAEDSLVKKKRDSVAISYKTFTGIVPDTLLEKQFGKTGRPRFYPLGKISVKNEETYLLIKALAPAQKAAYVLVFNKDKKFVTGLSILTDDNNAISKQTVSVDNKLSFTTSTQHKTLDGRLLYKKAAYAYASTVSAFILILTESNEAEIKKELFNPIDTFSAKNKLSGNYLQNKENLVAIRDSRKAGNILFFVHFEKADCKGELKGEAKIIAPGKALYRQSGDQCELEFSFKGNTVSLKEDGCGSHRDIKCFFEGSFVRKPPAKVPVKPAAKTAKPVKKTS